MHWLALRWEKFAWWKRGKGGGGIRERQVISFLSLFFSSPFRIDYRPRCEGRGGDRIVFRNRQINI